MIKQIRVKDYILIDELTADFAEGLNVITGETGAGKSILINAIDIAFASRVSKDVIKSNASKAIIELIIENEKHDLSALFEENGIDYNGAEIVITKEISVNAVRSRVNGTLVGQDFIKQLKNYFLDIHSQHQTYSFLQPKCHINLLDNYAKGTYGNLLAEYKSDYADLLLLKKQLDGLQNSADVTQSQLDFLKFQVDEIFKVDLQQLDEDDKLARELEVLENAEKLKELTGTSYWAINGDDGSILEALGKIKLNISKSVSYDENLLPVERSLLDAIENLREVGNDLRNYSQNLNNDEMRLNNIQERLYELDKIKRKYGGTLENVLKTYDDLSNELSNIEFSTQNIEELIEEIDAKSKILETKAMTLSEYRINFAQVLSVLIEEKLANLELAKSRFKIEVRRGELGANGIDEVEFFISTNVSEELKPLAKVASGGEVSRVMLAIKSIFAQADDINTVIFDEIDTGISGKASQSVADEIKALAKSHQIILITHQAIIASKADKHFYVKKSQNNSTTVDVYVLDDLNKLNALAEMAGGEINEKSLAFARSLV
ncbi:MAG: DNA repair protein RecN [Candidatus Gastranaerophilales bacterium]